MGANTNDNSINFGTAAVSAGGGLIASAMANHQAKKNRQFQEKMADKAYVRQKEAADVQWQREQAAAMYDKHWNSIGQQKIRALAAGMNPVDVNMAAAPSTASPTAPDNSAASAAPYQQLMSGMAQLSLRPQDILGNVIDVGTTALQYGLDKQRVANDTIVATEKAKGERLANYLQESTMAEQIKRFSLENDTLFMGLKETAEKIANLASSTDLNKNQARVYGAEADYLERTIESRVECAKWQAEYEKNVAEEKRRQATELMDKLLAEKEQEIRESVSRVSLNQANSSLAYKSIEKIGAEIPVIHQQEYSVKFDNAIAQKTFNSVVEKVKAECKISQTDAEFAVAQRYSSMIGEALKDIGVGAASFQVLRSATKSSGAIGFKQGYTSKR